MLPVIVRMDVRMGKFHHVCVAQARKGAKDEDVPVNACSVIGELDIHHGLQFRGRKVATFRVLRPDIEPRERIGGNPAVLHLGFKFREEVQERDGFSGTGGHLLQLGGACFQLAVAQHHAIQGADLIGILHLSLDAAPHQVALDGIALPPQLGGQPERLLGGRLSHRSNIKIALLGLREIAALLLHHHEEPLQPHGKADALHIRAAQLLTKPAIAPAAAQRGEAGNGNLKDGTGVVIQPANDAGIDGEGDIGILQKGLYFLKVAAAVIAQIIQHTGGAFGDLAADGGFTIQNAHGVFLQALFTGFAQILPAALEVGAQGLVVLGAAGGAASRWN